MKPTSSHATDSPRQLVTTGNTGSSHGSPAGAAATGTSSEVPTRGPKKTDRVSLGIAILHSIALPKVCYTHEEIAAFAGCTEGTIRQIEMSGLRKIRKALMNSDPEIMETLGAIFFDQRSTAKASRQSEPII